MKAVRVHRVLARLGVVATFSITVFVAAIHPSNLGAAPTSSDATNTVKVKPAGVSLDVPKPWVRTDLTKESLEHLADTLAAQNPETAAQIREFSGFAEVGSKFFAIDLATGNGVFVLLGPGAGSDLPSDLPSFKDSYTTEGLGEGDKLLEVERVKVGGKTAFRTLVSTTMTSPAGEDMTRLVGQLILRRGGDLVVVTVGTTDDEPGRHTISDVLGSVRPLSQTTRELLGKAQA